MSVKAADVKRPQGTNPGTETGPQQSRTQSVRNSPNTRDAENTRDADDMAVGSFILGLVGLLVGNLLLGPTAIVLALLALRGGTARAGRARFGMVLGVADLVVITTLVTVDGTLSWGY